MFHVAVVMVIIVAESYGALRRRVFLTGYKFIYLLDTLTVKSRKLEFCLEKGCTHSLRLNVLWFLKSHITLRNYTNFFL